MVAKVSHIFIQHTATLTSIKLEGWIEALEKK